MDKCNFCLNSRIAISENGYHYVCNLSQKKVLKCMQNKWCEFIKDPRVQNKQNMINNK